MIDDRIIIQFHAEASPQLKELAVRYWNRDESGNFLEAVSSIASDIGLSPVSLLDCLRKWSVVSLENTCCESCAEPFEIDCRNELMKRLRYPVCYACASAGYSRTDFGASTQDSENSSVSAYRSAAEDHGEQTASEPHASPSTAEPIKVFADQVIALEDFQKNPAGAMAACSGASLIVMSDNKPLFYCVSPELMQSVQSPG